jgi:hypothetical protein
MPPMLAKCLVVALMTKVLVLLGSALWVQPSSRLSKGPTVIPNGPHSFTGRTPVFVAESNAPITAVGPENAVGSSTSNPPLQVISPASCP